MVELSYTDNRYRTAPRRISWLARHFPSLVFYAKYLWIVFRSCAHAKWWQYTDQDWVDGSLEVMRALESVGVEFEISGVEYLEKCDGPCVVVANHMSTLETMVLPGIIQPIREVTFVVKASLIDYPVFKHVMRSRNPIAVGQTDPRRDFVTMMEEGTLRLQNGISLIIFPEGNRRNYFDPEEMNTIGVKLGRRAKAPIVPAAIRSDAWGIGSPLKDFGRIDPDKKVGIAFGEPLEVNGRGIEEQAAIVDFIGRKLRAWQFPDIRVPDSNRSQSSTSNVPE